LHNPPTISLNLNAQAQHRQINVLTASMKLGIGGRFCLVLRSQERIFPYGAVKRSHAYGCVTSKSPHRILMFAMPNPTTAKPTTILQPTRYYSQHGTTANTVLQPTRYYSQRAAA
jgi:hypothetical protein